MSTPPQIAIPARIPTERLTLRHPEPGDGVALNAAVIASLPELEPWLPWAMEAPTIAESEAWCAGAPARLRQREEIAYLLIERHSDRLVGAASLLRGDWVAGRFEMGYWCRSDRVGRGYIGEAVRALIGLAFTTLGLHRVEIRCDARNRRSAAVAERAGFRLEGRMREDVLANDDVLRDTLVYGLLATDRVG